MNNKEEIEEILKMTDTNHDGQLDYNEFIESMNKVKLKKNWIFSFLNIFIPLIFFTSKFIIIIFCS